ncbi:hypothetical protein GCM10010466_29610 [Planomonospora alba]|uniref:Uncharacterized protein n=1 Tax=Planomonospora alba TaxID=161354 RepID=A0ABP6N5L7_9ACTN
MLSEKVMSVAVSVGRRVAGDWPMFDPEDITQEILTQACTRPADYNGMDTGTLYHSLTREAVAWCARERADYVTRSARYLYTPAEVRELLELWADGGEAAWSLPPTKDGYLAAPDAGNIVVNVWDVKTAIGKLPESWQAVIIRRIVGETLTPAEYRTWCRAVDRLTLTLNRTVNRLTEHDGPGARRAVSNTRALAMTASERDG